MAFQWQGFNPLTRPQQGVSLNYTPQVQQIGSPLNAKNLASMNKALVTPAVAPAGPVAGPMTIPQLGVPQAYRGKIGGQFLSMAQQAADDANKANNLQAYLAGRERIQGLLNKGLSLRHGSGRSGR
jgi:hypothetical protein